VPLDTLVFRLYYYIIGSVPIITSMPQEVIKMKTIKVSLFSNTDVKDFVNIVSKYDFDIDLVSGRYVVDAKSIMGIFSLDLTKPIQVDLHTDDADAIIEELKPYTVQ